MRLTHLRDIVGKVKEQKPDQFSSREPAVGQEDLHGVINTADYEATSVIPSARQQITSLMGFFLGTLQKTVPSMRLQFQLVSALQTRTSSLTSDSTRRLSFTSQTL